MRPRLLVVTTVHPADDPRIREKHIRTLAVDFDVTYATKAPSPSDTEGIDWRVLTGGRVVRWFKALGLMSTTRADVVAIHDPELIPAGILARFVRRKPIVFDLHENVPAQLQTKTSIPRALRRSMAGLTHSWLSLAERFLSISLAENG